MKTDLLRPLGLAFSLMAACSEVPSVTSVEDDASSTKTNLSGGLSAVDIPMASVTSASFTSQPPVNVPWSGKSYTWTVSTTGCGPSDPPCSFGWLYCRTTVSMGYGQCLDWAQVQTTNNVAADSYSRPISAGDSVFYLRVDVVSSSNTINVYSNIHRPSGACSFVINGTKNIFTSGNYNYSYSLSGNTAHNCPSITRLWGGDASGTAATATVYYDVCPWYSYEQRVNLTLTSQGSSNSKFIPISILTDPNAC